MAPTKPILIAGPTASGKSALSLALAEVFGGVIINADALQVYENWRVLTARPSIADEAAAPHRLYGHVSAKDSYSVGAWLRDVQREREAAELAGLRPIIIGGTGLYFSALTEGLAEIPEIPAEIRQRGDELRETLGISAFAQELSQRDPVSWAKIDQRNPARLQRAWEVLEATGTGIAAWQERTGPAALDVADAIPLCLDADRDWLAARIEKRFDIMLAEGALEEAKAWRNAALPRSLPAGRALGAPELLDYLAGLITLDEAAERAKIGTRQFAKRQRTWFRNRMANWHRIDLSAGDPIQTTIDLIAATD